MAPAFRMSLFFFFDMHWKNIAGSVILIIFFGAAYVESTTFPEQVGIYPKIICVIGIVLALTLILKSLKGLKDSPTAEKLGLSLGAFAVVAATLIGVTVYVFLMQSLGYVSATALFFLVFAYLFDPSSKLYLYPLAAVVVTGVIYALFSMALHIPLPQGSLI